MKAGLVTIAISTIYRHELLNFRKQLDESLVKRVILSVMSLHGYGTKLYLKMARNISCNVCKYTRKLGSRRVMPSEVCNIFRTMDVF